MNVDLYASMTGVAIGIRFENNFHIEKHLGEIVDNILYNSKSYFNPQRFPFVENGIGEKVLLNRDTGDKLQFNYTDVILDIKFGDNFPKSDYKSIMQHFNDDVIKVLIDKGISRIIRIGILKKYLISNKVFSNNLVCKTIGKSITDVTNIDLLFSKKYPEDEALVKKNINDYYNANYSFKKTNSSDDVLFFFDFQRYFSPALNNLNEFNFKSFSDYVNNLNSKQLSKWINEEFCCEI